MAQGNRHVVRHWAPNDNRMPATESARNGAGEIEALALLRESATPDLYRRNGFRVLELPVDATPREVNRRRQMTEMAVSSGMSLQAGPGRCFPLDPEPDEFAVRDAVQRVGDPEQRLVDEFFWFWPHEHGQSRSDHGLQQLLRGDHERASAIWSEQEANRSISHVSTHNLAVLHHLLALEWENSDGRENASREAQARADELWGLAFHRWKRLLDEEPFWQRLTERVREFDDPRLTAGTVRRLRSSLPVALLGINARLVLRAVELGNDGVAQRLVGVIRKSGFAEEMIADGLRQAVAPVRARIKTLCAAAEQSLSSDAIHADRACRQLLDSVQPLLAGVDSLLNPGDPTRDVAHDDVAEHALRCQVAFVKATDNWSVSLALLLRAAGVAASESVQKKLQGELDTVRGKADANDDFRGDGYFDLPESLFAEMEEARRLADSQDYDGAIARLERITVQEPDHRAALNKASAYCFGWRAVIRMNQAANSKDSDSIPAVVSRIIENAKKDKLDDSAIMAARIGTVPAGSRCHCMSCTAYISGRYMTFEFREIKMLVCGNCADKLKAEQEAGREKLRVAVRASAVDYLRAGELDPANRFIQRKLTESKELCTTVGVPFPTSADAWTAAAHSGRTRPADCAVHTHKMLVCTTCGHTMWGRIFALWAASGILWYALGGVAGLMLAVYPTMAACRGMLWSKP